MTASSLTYKNFSNLSLFNDNGTRGGKVGIAPRIFLKKLVGDVLDRVDQHPDFDPRRHYQLTIADHELTELERHARAASHVDDIELP